MGCYFKKRGIMADQLGQRYFFEVAYKGTDYSGFQVQENASTIQGELEKVLSTFYKTQINLTGSSRTDAGVHAHQNYFHGDLATPITSKNIYNLNAMLPPDIVLKQVYRVPPEAHARFDAVSRTYKYLVYREKSPFKADRAWYYPFPLDLQALNKAANTLIDHRDYEAFAKRNSQVHTYNCEVMQAEWKEEGGYFVFQVKANRFLRGMVRGLVATMLKVGRGAMLQEEWLSVLNSKDQSLCDFSAPSQGLFLISVEYPYVLESVE